MLDELSDIQLQLNNLIKKIEAKVYSSKLNPGGLLIEEAASYCKFLKINKDSL